VAMRKTKTTFSRLKYRINSNGTLTYSGNDIFIPGNRANSFESTVRYSKILQKGAKKFWSCTKKGLS
jgi:hypothetical protein